MKAARLQNFVMAQRVAAKGSASNPTGRGISKVTWQKLRDNAMSKTEFYDISQQSKLLPELRTGSLVHPQLEAVDFYKEGRMSQDDYIPQTLRSHHERKDEHGSGYRKDIALDDILENFKEGQISFVGQAGSGKTTLMKAITRQVIEGKYQNLNNIEVVHFVHLRTFKRNDSVTPAELLFRNVTPEMSDAEMKGAMQYAKENPDKVLFIIDSLDTVSYTIDGVYTGITTDDRASPEAILFHFLSGNLLPGCRFITSSREYAIRNYKGDVRAKQVIALAGLSKESMRNIVVGYVGEEEAEEKMTYLKRKPVIESLCVTPVWLIFTMMVLSIESNFTPTTMAGILVVLLQNMIRSEHVHERNIEIVVGKLAKMAFTGTKERRVEFSLDQLGNFNLSASEICDLMVVTPSGGYQKLILGDSILMFAHQCLQEILSAFHIAKMNLNEFKEFISKYIHEPHYAVVRRLLAGILLNSEVFEEAENFLQDATDFAQKRLCLRKSLEGQLKSGLCKADRLELYMCLSECGDGARDIIQNKVDRFNFSVKILSSSEMYCIGWVMSLQTSVTILNLSTCNLTQPSLSALYHALECGNVQLHKLDVSNNKTLGPDEMAFIAKIFVQCKVKILTLIGCEPGSDALRAFLDSSVGGKLDELDVSVNTFGPDEMMVIPQICKQRGVDRFIVRCCNFLSGALESFLFHSVGAKLHELDMSFNERLGPDEMALIAKIFVQCKVKIWKLVQLKGMKARCPKSDALKAFLDSPVGAKLDKVDVSGNTFGPDEMMVIAQICKHRAVDRFHVRGCEFLSGALESFLFHSVGAKISLLHIDLYKLSQYSTPLGKIIKQCGVETLSVWQSYERAGIDLKVFRLFPDNFKISTLECAYEGEYVGLGDHLGPLFDKFSDYHCGVVSEFLPHVAKEVILINCRVPSHMVKILQNRLDVGRTKGLKIIIKVPEEIVEGKKLYHKVLEWRKPPAGNGSLQQKNLTTIFQPFFSKAQREADISRAVPSIVENRRAELNNDGSIAVSWHYPDEDPGVRYHVETFCNNQPTGDIEICRDPYYQCKTPRPSQLHCFKIWVVDSNGIAGESMFTNEVMSCGLDESTLPGTSVARDVPAQSEKETEQDIAAGSIVREERTQTMSKGPPPQQKKGTTIFQRFFSKAQRKAASRTDILDESTLPGTSVARDVPALSEKGTEQDIASGSIVRDERTRTMTKGPPTRQKKGTTIFQRFFSKTQRKAASRTDQLDENTLPGTSVARDVPSQTEKETEQDIAAGSIMKDERTQTMTKDVPAQSEKETEQGITAGSIVRDKRTQTMTKGAIMDADEARIQTQPSEVPDPKLVLEEAKIRVSWDEVEDQRVTYCIDLYCNGQKQNPESYRTPAMYIEFPRLEPSCEYRCEVWARNLHGVDGLKTWSNAAKTGATVDAEEVRRQAKPSEVPDLKLVLEKTKIRVSWDELEDERVTYCIDLYCNGQKRNTEPYRTPANCIDFSRLEPSCEYRCEVWARNSHGVDGLKTWSNAAKTDEGFQAPASSSQSSNVPQVVIKELHVGGNAFVGGRGEQIDKKDQKSLKSGRSGED